MSHHTEVTDEQNMSPVTGPPRTKPGEATCRCPLEAAELTLFPDQGYHEAPIVKITERVGVGLADDGHGALRPATSYQTVVDDTVDMNTGTALPAALAGLRHPTRLLTVPRGLQNEQPGLYPVDFLTQILPSHPTVQHTRIEGFNHYTIAMSPVGAQIVADTVTGVVSLHS